MKFTDFYKKLFYLVSFSAELVASLLVLIFFCAGGNLFIGTVVGTLISWNIIYNGWELFVERMDIKEL